MDALCFAYPQQVLFTGLSARIPAGVSLVRGGDGRGKSTLLRLMAGELAAQAGTVQIKQIRLDTQAQAYRQQVFWTDPRTTAFDPISPSDYFKLQKTLWPAFDNEVLSGLIEGLSLTAFLEKPLYMLSTGSKRKVWLAAAFASGAAVTLLDEPFAALDKTSINFVLALLHEAAQHPSRAWVLAHYEAPGDVPLASTIELGDA